MNDSTAVPSHLLEKFQSNPIGIKVCLPDGALALIVKYRDTDKGRIFSVRGIGENNQFVPIRSISTWFSGLELRLVWYEASIDPNWVRS